MDKTNILHKRFAILTAVFLLLLSIGSLTFLLLSPGANNGYTAEIYQSGILIRSIPLNEVKETYTFTIVGDNGCTNEIQVRPGSIGILSADCPDKICINQGFISDSRLPITCLPNRLVVQLRPTTDDGTKPDIVAY